MKNDQDTRMRSVADLRARYPLLVKQIADEAAAEERLRLKQLYCATSSENGETLMIQAAERTNAARRVRAN